MFVILLSVSCLCLSFLFWFGWNWHSSCLKSGIVEFCLQSYRYVCELFSFSSCELFWSSIIIYQLPCTMPTSSSQRTAKLKPLPVFELN
jgi:hypothetical protein